MAPKGLPYDNTFDLCIASAMGKFRILQILPTFMNGTQATQPEITTGRARKVTVTALKGTLPAHCDGETLCTRAQRVAAERVSKAKTILLEKLSEPLSLEDLGKQVACSHFYLSRTFTRETGLTISQWLRRARLEEGLVILRAPGYCASGGPANLRRHHRAGHAADATRASPSNRRVRRAGDARRQSAPDRRRPADTEHRRRARAHQRAAVSGGADPRARGRRRAHGGGSAREDRPRSRGPPLRGGSRREPAADWCQCTHRGQRL